MNPNLNPFDNRGNQRSRKTEFSVESDSGSVDFNREEIMKLSDDGSIDSITRWNTQIVNGENIRSPLQISGQCTICKQFLTFRSIRHCLPCGKVICPECACWDDIEERFYCEECWKPLKRKRFWRRFWQLLIAPFVEKTEA